MPEFGFTQSRSRAVSTARWLRFIAVTALLCLGAETALAQSTTTSSAAGTSGADSTATTPAVTTPTPANAGSSAGGAGQRPIFLSGVVMMDDGSALPGSVTIQSLCGTVRRAMGHADGSTGAFGFQWTTTTTAFGDASQNARLPVGNGPAALTGSRNGSRGLDPVANCELLAEQAGYSSSRASLYNRAGQEIFNVGTIVLHRIAAGEGHTVSVLALHAPKDAKKNFDRGTSLAAANKPVDALAGFQAAVAIYPEYADAWLSMGKVQWQIGMKDEARASFAKAMELDSKLVGSWQELGYMACDSSQWEDAVRYLDQAVRLDPLDSPNPWYYDALANYNLGHFEQAERDVRAERKLDHGQNPLGDFLLGLVLIARHDLQGGADALRNYIASAPQSADVNLARRELSRLESALGQ